MEDFFRMCPLLINGKLGLNDMLYNIVIKSKHFIMPQKGLKDEIPLVLNYKKIRTSRPLQ